MRKDRKESLGKSDGSTKKYKLNKSAFDGIKDFTGNEESLISTEYSGKIEDWSIIELKQINRGREVLLISLVFLVTVIVLISYLYGVAFSDWTPWKQTELFRATTLGVLFGFYFRK